MTNEVNVKIYMFNNKIMSFNDVWFKEPDIPTSVVIGTQTWKINSLDVDDGGDGIVVLNGVTYYTQAAAIRVANSISGWHLPSVEEYNTLLAYAGGSDYAGAKLASTSDWSHTQGLDTYGFNAKPYGRYDNGYANSYGEWAPFWTSTSYDWVPGYGVNFNIGYAGPAVYSFNAYIDIANNTDYFQARLIKD